MENANEIVELLKHSATKIKGDKALFSDFVRLYIAEGGKSTDCMGCNFSATYNRWKRQLVQPVKKLIMGNGKKTFVLHDASMMAHVLQESWVFSNKSDDETAIKWINQFDGKHAEERKKKFSKLPEGLEEKAEEVVKTVQNYSKKKKRGNRK